jgi:hypothetical protein
MSERCECECFECRIGRHDICHHLIKCIKRPRGTYDWPTIPADATPDDYDADAIWQAWVDAEESPDAYTNSGRAVGEEQR